MEQIRDLKPVIECRGISKEFTNERGTTRVVDHFDLEVSENEFVVLFGPGQCGKTTLLNLLSGLELPTTGETVINGRTVTGPDPERGFVYQTTALFPWLTVMGNVSFGPRVQGVKKEEWHRRAEKYIRLVGLEGFEKSFPNQLSGGMRQRVVIAIALACHPELIIADEPTTALDVTVQAQILSLLKDLQAEMGSSSILITHDLGVIAQSCDSVVVMYAGRVVEKAPVRELFANPRHAYTRGLLASIPQLSSVRKTKLPTIPGQVASIADFVPGCRFCQRQGVPAEELTERPPLVEISPDHFVEACPRCANL